MDVFHGEKPLAKIRIRNNKIDAYLSLDSNSVYNIYVPNRKEGGSYAGLPFFVDSPELYVTYSKGEGDESRIYSSSESPLKASPSVHIGKQRIKRFRMIGHRTIGSLTACCRRTLILRKSTRNLLIGIGTVKITWFIFRSTREVGRCRCLLTN